MIEISHVDVVCGIVVTNVVTEVVVKVSEMGVLVVIGSLVDHYNHGVWRVF